MNTLAPAASSAVAPIRPTLRDLVRGLVRELMSWHMARKWGRDVERLNTRGIVPQDFESLDTLLKK